MILMNDPSPVVGLYQERFVRRWLSSFTSLATHLDAPLILILSNSLFRTAADCTSRKIPNLMRGVAWSRSGCWCVADILHKFLLIASSISDWVSIKELLPLPPFVTESTCSFPARSGSRSWANCSSPLFSSPPQGWSSSCRNNGCCSMRAKSYCYSTLLSGSEVAWISSNIAVATEAA